MTDYSSQKNKEEQNKDKQNNPENELETEK